MKFSSGSSSDEIAKSINQDRESFDMKRIQSESKHYESYFQIEDGDGGSPYA